LAKKEIPDKKKEIQKQKSSAKPLAKTLAKPEIKFLPKPQKAISKPPEKESSSPLFLGIIIIVLISVLLMLFGFSPGDIVKAAEKPAKINEELGINEITNENGNTPKTFDERYDLCLNISSVQAKDECLQTVAVEFNQDFLCDELTNIDSESCKREVWKAFAVLSQEVEKCNALSNELDRADCIKQIALFSSDKTICFEIGELSKKNGCLIELAVQEKDLIICDSIEGSAIDTCQFNTVIEISDVSLCDIFSLPSIRFNCIAEIAKANNDISLCTPISNDSIRKKCVNDLS